MTAPTATDPRAATLVAMFRRETAITRKLLRAFPPEQADFKPHERSSTAKTIAWTFVVEARLGIYAIREGDPIGKGFAPPPETWGEILDEFDARFAELESLMASADAERLDAKVPFFVGPKQMGEYPTADFLWFLLHDHIHHRGQLSVYLRMVGGKVPSIYGPTADEPWS
jgi:uncharacterized damage-inducible protein DinB